MLLVSRHSSSMKEDGRQANMEFPLVLSMIGLVF